MDGKINSKEPMLSLQRDNDDDYKKEIAMDD